MMLGHLDDAIRDVPAVAAPQQRRHAATATRRRARPRRANRDRRGRTSATPAGPTCATDFLTACLRRAASFFFVPDGEKYYYAALINEAFGKFEEALADWQHFLASGAHPQYRPRAQARIPLNKARPT